jgi:hypothetical protein
MVSKRKQVAMLSVPGRGRQFVAKLNTCTKSTTAKTRKLSPPDVQKRKKSVPTQERVPGSINVNQQNVPSIQSSSPLNGERKKPAQRCTRISK